jgi:hypothetical protein
LKERRFEVELHEDVDVALDLEGSAKKENRFAMA